MMQMFGRRSAVAALIGACLTPQAVPARTVRPSLAVTSADATALARRVADAYAEMTAGVIGLRSESRLVVPGMGARPSTERAWYVYVDGAVVETGSGDGTIGAMEAQMHQPYQRRYVNEYSYAFAPCPGCAPGEVAIAYETAAHDVRHGSGTMVVDPTRRRVVRADISQYVVPHPARSGLVSLAWGAIADAWLPLSATGAFVGRVGPFGGTARLTQTFTEYRRYPDVASAERGLGVTSRGDVRQTSYGTP